MKKIIKSYVLILLSLMLLLALAACGNDSQQAGTTGSPSTQPEQEVDKQEENEEQNGGVLVTYFSASGSTEAVAKYIAEELGTDTFAITPVEPYTSEDLNWRDDSSRVNREHEDESLRAVDLVATSVENWEDYDTVFIGYPIWWGIAAWPTNGFVQANNFDGKTVIPFCTSTSSGLGNSAQLLAELAGTGNWQTGQRFPSSVSKTDVQDWLQGLNISASQAE